MATIRCPECQVVAGEIIVIDHQDYFFIITKSGRTVFQIKYDPNIGFFCFNKKCLLHGQFQLAGNALVEEEKAS